MIYYPTVCVDNFLDNPDHVRNYALTLDYTPDEDGQWQGMRTDFIHKINKTFFMQVCKRYLGLHYTSEEMNNISYEARMHFQQIKGDKSTGWIHADWPDKHTVIMYLTPGVSSDSGTSIYRPKNPVGLIGADLSPYTPVKTNLHKGNISPDEAQPALLKYNNHFEETARFRNLYNRCIGFDSHLWHGANDFKSDEERLTLIIFFKSINGPSTGLQRSRAIVENTATA